MAMNADNKNGTNNVAATLIPANTTNNAAVTNKNLTAPPAIPCKAI